MFDYNDNDGGVGNGDDNGDGDGSSSDGSSNTTGIIAGVVVALILAVAIAIVAGFIIRRRMIKRASARMTTVNASSLDGSRIRMDKKLHTGYFGERWRGSYDGQQVTIKQVENDFASDDALEASKLPSHNNVVSVTGTAKSGRTITQIIQEFIPDAKSLTEMDLSSMSTSKLVNILRKVAKGIQHIHDNNMVRIKLVTSTITSFNILCCIRFTAILQPVTLWSVTI